MRKNRRLSVNAAAKEEQAKAGPEEVEMKRKIVEIKGKIKMKERGRITEAEKFKSEIADNDKTILYMRSDNCSMRGRLRKALDADDVIVSETLDGRKRERLALTGKSTSVAINEIDQTVCDQARRLNDLVHQRQTRLKKIEELLKKAERESRAIRVVDDDVESDECRRYRQLENSIDKAKLKTSSAFMVKGLYSKIRSVVEDKIRGYPKKLDELEKTILSGRQELQELRKMQKVALAEKEEATTSKNKFESLVRRERKERETDLRQMQKKVSELAFPDLPHTTKKSTRKMKEAQHIANMARRAQETIDKVKAFQEKASMIEIVTGIPFVNNEAVVNCLQTQKNSAEYLKKKTTQNEKLLKKNKKLLEHYGTLYDRLIYEHDASVEEKIKKLTSQCDEAKSLKQKTVKANEKHQRLLVQFYEWLDPIAKRLASSCQRLDLPAADLILAEGKTATREEECQDVMNLFNLYVELITDLSRVVDGKMATLEESELPHEGLVMTEKDDDKIVDANNNRIALKLERKVSEDFDFNIPKNDTYLSRETIKRQAESRQRGKRGDK